MFELLVGLGVPERGAQEFVGCATAHPDAWFWCLDWACESITFSTDDGDYVERECAIGAQGRRGTVVVERGEDGWYIRRDKTYESQAFHMVERGPDGVLRLRKSAVSE